MSVPGVIYLCLETPREGQASYTHVHEIIAGLRECGFAVDLVATDGGGASSGSSILRRVAGYARAHLAFFRRLRSADAVYMRAHFAALPASLVARLFGKPVIQELNGKPADVLVTYPGLGWLSGLIQYSYRLQLRLAAHVIAVTPGLGDWVQSETGHRRVSVIPNGANTDHFSPSGPRGPVDGSYVIFCGGLVAWHGVANMLSATESSAWPDTIRLVIVGDGPERGLVRAALGSHRLEWLGQQPYADMPALLRGSIAALCVISDPDGRSATGVAPLKLYEAMACGVPVIVSDLPHQSDIVRTEQAGLVIPANDPDALAAAVADLVRSPDRAAKMGRAGADYVRDNASWLARARETGRIIDAAIDGGKPGRR
jgi:glycosyltransferase involved in cell wall biosynthesis